MTNTNAEIQAIITQCAMSRTWFFENILGFVPDKWQARVADDLDSGTTRVSIVSGHGVGKTALCAVTALHFLLFRPNSTKVIITSPSASQLLDGMWSELQVWIEKLPDFLKEQLEVKNRRIVDVNAPESRFISLRTARIESPEALAGIHAENVLLLCDEASGIGEPIWQAAGGTLSTLGSIAVLIGNPTRTSGYFYRTQHTLRDHWSCYRVTSMDSPRVSQSFIEDIRRTYGEHSAQFKIRVLGEFADLGKDIIIPRELVESAVGRDIRPLADDPVFWGVDVIGIGAGVADRLRELGLPVIDVNVAESPALKNRYPRLRDELWYNARDWFESRRVSLPAGDMGEELVEELCAPLVVIHSDGRSGAESKADMKRRGVASPNLADALNLTFAFGASAAAGRTAGGSASWGVPLSRSLSGVA